MTEYYPALPDFETRSKSLEWISTAPPKIYDPGPPPAASAQQEPAAPATPPTGQPNPAPPSTG